MKIAFLNLPNKSQVIRRYMCSYNAPNFLFPPLELMYLASVAKSWNKAQVWILDAIAEGMDGAQVEQTLSKIDPDLVVFMCGFEIFQEDIEIAIKLKNKFAQAKFVVFGYLASIFPFEVLAKTNLDFCLMEEPEMTFFELCQRLAQGLTLDGLEGLAFKNGAFIKVNPRRVRIQDLDQLPYPAKDLLDNNLYGEPLMKRPFTLIQTARGCPFSCTYCVRSFGSKLICRSVESIISEIEECVTTYEIKSLRFIDDTLNADRQRASKIAQMLLDRNLRIEWTALSRADTLEAKTLALMRKAGCRRLYIGIESGSQRILDLYKKGYKIDQVKEAVRLVNNSGIETVGFFMVGAPGENEKDFQASLRLAKELHFDYIVVFKAISYPGTALFNQFRDRIEFSLFPYVNRLKDLVLDEKYNQWEQLFYRDYYFRPAYILRRIMKFLQHPIQSFKGLFCILKYTLVSANRKTRPDFI